MGSRVRNHVGRVWTENPHFDLAEHLAKQGNLRSPVEALPV